MKVLTLCLLLFFCVSVTRAQEPSVTQSEKTTIEESAAKTDPMVLKSEVLVRPSTFCAFLRTYRVKRDYAGSDAVSPASYMTCVPTQRFEVRSAVEIRALPAVPESTGKADDKSSNK